MMKTLGLVVLLTVLWAAAPCARASEQMRATLDRGLALCDSLEYKEALNYLRPLAQQYPAARNKEEKALCLEALYGCIDANIHMSNFMAAYDDILTAQDIVDCDGLSATKLHLNLGRLYIVLTVHIDKRNFAERALDHSRRGFYSAIREGDARSIMYTFSDMVTECLILADFSKIEKEYAAMRRLQPHGPEWMYSYAMKTYEAHKAYVAKDYATARRLYGEILALLPVNRSTVRMRLNKIKDMALLNLTQHRPDDVLAAMPDALRQAMRSRQDDIRFNIYNLLIMAYEQKGDSLQQRKYSTMAVQLKDSMRSATIADDLSQLEFFRERRTLTNQLATASMRQKIWLWSFVAALLVIIAVAGVALVLRSKNRALRRHAARIYSQLCEKYVQTPDSKSTTPATGETTAETSLPDETEAEDTDTQNKYEGSTLTEAHKRQIAETIDRVMKTDIIFSADLTLRNFAAEVGRHPKAVSQVIHELKGCNFSTLINRARIVEVMRRMESADYAHLSTEAIGESVGFASRNTFGMNFKKFTGLSLREYRKAAKDVKQQKPEQA